MIKLEPVKGFCALVENIYWKEEDATYLSSENKVLTLPALYGDVSIECAKKLITTINDTKLAYMHKQAIHPYTQFGEGRLGTHFLRSKLSEKPYKLNLRCPLNEGVELHEIFEGLEVEVMTFGRGLRSNESL
jgi:hypothetical protein